MARTNTADQIAALTTLVATLADQVATLATRPAIVAAPAEPSAASAHWAARDLACPRGCGRTDFRTVAGAAGAHRNPKGATCK